MNIEIIVNKLKDRNIKAVSKGAGLHYNTVYRILKNPSCKPQQKTIQKLTNYMEVN